MINQNKKRPNILFLMCDQLQAEVLRPDSACLTPHIDNLAVKGIRFDRAYTPNPVCSPARASLMTGLLPHNHGVLQVIHTVDEDQCNLRINLPHWAEFLEAAGYYTGYFGKWHIERTNELENFGWKVNGAIGTTLYNEKKAVLLEDVKKQKFFVKKTIAEPPGYNSENLLYGVTNINPEQRNMGIITSLACDFLDDQLNQDKPWCCFVSIPEPHDPFICGEEAFKKYIPEEIVLKANVHDPLFNRPNIYKKASNAWANMTDSERKLAVACYYASITEIDELFGKLLEKLEMSGQIDNTLIILTSDHGELLGSHGMYCKNYSAFEEIYNIPLIIAGPGIAKGVTTRARVGLHDLAPTLIEWAGYEMDQFKYPDSKSFLSVLKKPEINEKYFEKGFAEYHGGRMLLTQRVTWDGDWKYVFNGFDFDELYNLKQDPHEMHNLIDDPNCQEIVQEMCRLMWQTVVDTDDHSLYKSHYPILRVAPYGPQIIDKT